MNKQRNIFSLRLFFSLLLLIIGASLLFNRFMNDTTNIRFKHAENEHLAIKPGKTDKTYTGTIERINNDEEGHFSSFLLKEVKGIDSDMFNQGVTILADGLAISGAKTSFEELAVGDKIELITVENAAVTMMIPPSIAGNAVVGINVLD